MEKILNFSEIDTLAKKIANYASENTVIALIGDLGTGKTTFTKTFAKEFGVKENLKSPTFNYVLEYLTGRLPLYHFDVYRLCNSEEIYEIGYEDYINNGGVALIEWADIILDDLPKEYIRIDFSYSTKDDERKVNIKYIGNSKKEEELLNYVDFGN
ncbi:tRNA (adenosine(37)-N6)-threonylcarbamoyltransferase complex ATPase subunit type 1 TsaE [Fusobacterium massiliense]|uniref:tRNA (adenosine(37)-N6)-threonylcarbamoyltransferase complex ATPase subunit type 1 TsaE n=1 Tax=Fusobacterium massiliense TaxID=1852365 RepID=UPI0028EBEB39|nr:tRNA (adenosine(37)-N6)-threonylcarbamoyltransferase complex ATPase subunit type 1 TsaE [Fusobacterium massiliense]